MARPQLTFDHLTDVALAVEKGRMCPEDGLNLTAPGDLGPIVELVLRLERWNLDLAREASLDSRLGRCLRSSRRSGLPAFDRGPEGSIGVLRVSDVSPQASASYAEMDLRAKHAAISSGISDAGSTMLVGAMVELRDNVIEHSENSKSGLIAFRGTPGRFEYTVADAGKGVLASLKENPEYASLTDSGHALRVALQDGESRYGRVSGRGLGFHDLFIGLQKLTASVHFKTGDHRLEQAGESPSLGQLGLAQCAHFQGFLISVSCLASLTGAPGGS